MTVGDVIYNDQFDFNANWAIYKCKSGQCWHDFDEPFLSTLKNGYDKPLDAVLDMPISYLTINNNILIIEVEDKITKQEN